MTTTEFLNKYDTKYRFSEQELFELWIDELFDDISDVAQVGEEEYGEPDRWNTCVTKVLRVEDRFFMIYCWRGNTEYQDSYYEIQPREVKPIQKIITVWEGV